MLEEDAVSVLGTLERYFQLDSERELTLMNQTRIPSDASSATYTPPPAAAKADPNEFALLSLKRQPEAPAPPAQLA